MTIRLSLFGTIHASRRSSNRKIGLLNIKQRFRVFSDRPIVFYYPSSVQSLDASPASDWLAVAAGH